MGNVTQEDLRKTQLIMLDVLSEIDRICKKYNLQYWIDGGALLGAVKYRGFVRWDDDLDVALPFEDYEKFCEVAQSELPKGMFFQHRKTEPTFPYDCVKIRDNRGVIVENHQVGKKITYNQGLFVDVYPVLAIKRGVFYRVLHIVLFLFVKLFSYKYLNIRSIRDFFVSLSEKMHIGWERDSKVVRSGNHPTIRFYVDKSSIFPLSTAQFEDKIVPVPNNVDSYLNSLFPKGYKRDLPQEKQKPSHAFSITIKDEK